MKKDVFDENVERYLDGEEFSETDRAELSRILREEEWARDRFIKRTTLGADLNYGEVGNSAEASVAKKPAPDKILWKLTALVLGAILLTLFVATLFRSAENNPNHVATIEFSDGAAWEGSVPTKPGSKLPPGDLFLKVGVSTIRFHSGAKVTLEAPAHLVLETPMRSRLLTGSAMIDVPDSAHGFVVETPDGYAVDHGTKFSVTVDSIRRESSFEVLSGEISVHHPKTKSVVRLTESKVARTNQNELSKVEAPLPEEELLPSEEQILRLNTSGVERTLTRSIGHPTEITHPDFLMAKYSSQFPAYGRRSTFGFDLSKVNRDIIESAKIRLNLVSCGLGFASRLPSQSSFSLYGIAGVDVSATANPLWDSQPPGKLLGTFKISRGQQTGHFSISSEELTDYLKLNPEKTVTILLVRDTDELSGNGLVHAFASSQHPEASGPTLELTLFNN